MANEQHLAIFKRGLEFWNAWRAKSDIRPDLSGLNYGYEPLYFPGPHDLHLGTANLRDVDLRGAKLHNAHLPGADLRGADLSGATLSCALLREANLEGANLAWANLFGAYLILTNLTGANLEHANLTRAEFCRVQFYNATVDATVFVGCDLSDAVGLDYVLHKGPSVIAVDTLYKSEGNISETFLRGCGVPDTLIRYLPSLVNSEDGIQFYSCFISYSSKDEQFARRLHGRMRDAHLRVWFAPEQMKGGNLLIEQIETAIRVYDKLLIVLSNASMQSEWVMTELRDARKAERQSGKRKLFPVRLVDMETIRDWQCFDSDSGKDLAVELREYFIPDFSNCKNHDQFETAFARLLKDLRAVEGSAGI